MLAANMARFLEMARFLPIEQKTLDLVVRVYSASALWATDAGSAVPIHCAKVAQVGFNLSKMVGLSKDKQETLLLGCLLHDSRKAREWRVDFSQINDGSHEKGYPASAEWYTRAAVNQYRWLNETTGREYTEAVHLAQLSGHASLEYFLSSKPSLEEKVLHLSDDLCKGDKVVILEERIRDLEDRYPWMTAEGPPEFGGKTWAEVQQQISVSILDEFAALQHKSGDELNRWLVESLIEE